jgi:single-stranded-DNA-specific exonuclease
MRGLTHRWSILSPSSHAAPASNSLLTRFLHARGYTNQFDADRFAKPKLTDLLAPSQLPGVDRAAERILSALRNRERIVVYGDYDADGICASSILFHTLQHLARVPPVGSSGPTGASRNDSALITTYIPHRIDEGYGLNTEAIESLARDDAKLIITVDCGITAHEPARAARRHNVDLIITDHHNPSAEHAELPDAFAIVHPRAVSTDYPFHDLCGAGVAFKLAWRLFTLQEGSDKISEPARALLLDLLALTAIGTVADVVPLVSENRIIARFGLRRVKSTALTGLAALVSASGLAGEEITSEHAGFALAPRLNACGRLEHAGEAVELLTRADPARALDIARKLTRLNEQRRRAEKQIFDHACQLAEERGMTRDDRRAIVLAHSDWHPGVVGIVCSRLVGKYHRPAILLNELDGRLHGSGRSIDCFNLHAAIASCAPLLEKFGGHDMAAGLALSREHLDAFTEQFTDYANANLTPDHLTPELRIDCEASAGELTPQTITELLDLGPFGRGNPAPRLLLSNLPIARDAEPFGSGGDHMSLFIRDGAREIRLIAWRWGNRRAQFRAGQRVTAVIEPKLNVWQGRTRVEPELHDAHVSS